MKFQSKEISKQKISGAWVYGQLADVKVSEGDYVKAGTVLARLAPVTKYYRLEGNHLYFASDGSSFRELPSSPEAVLLP